MDEIRISNANEFGAAPNVGLTNTITVPTAPHRADANTKLLLHFDGADEAVSTIDSSRLEAHSEATIKQQGSYALRAFAKGTDALNDTLTRTVSPTIDLSDLTMAHFHIYSSRTGSNIKVGIHDSGGTTSENTPNISSASTWEKQDWDISGISNANKDVIDSIIITIVNADSDNTFYLDYFFAGPYAQSVTGTLIFTDAITKKTSRSLADTLAFTDAIAKKTKRALADTLAFTDTITKKVKKVLADNLAFTDALVKKTKRVLSDTLVFTDTIVKKTLKSLSDTIVFTDSITKKIKKVLSDTISFTSRLLAWLEKGEPVSSWTEDSDPSSTWTEDSDPSSTWEED